MYVWEGLEREVHMSSLLYLVALLRSPPEIPQRWSSKIPSYCTFLWESAKSCHKKFKAYPGSYIKIVFVSGLCHKYVVTC